MLREKRVTVRMEGLEVVDDPADGLDVGVLRLPLVMTAVITALHDVHAAAEVRLFIHHPRSVSEHSHRVDAAGVEAAALEEGTVVTQIHALPRVVTALEQLHAVVLAVHPDRSAGAHVIVV